MGWHTDRNNIILTAYLVELRHGTDVCKPENIAEIQRRLRAPRPSLALSEDSLRQEYKEFQRLNDRTPDEQLVIKKILLILEGPQQASFHDSSNYPFTNLAPLTNGTLANAKPDIYYGAPPHQLHPRVREQLSDQVIPTRQGNSPITPNFFVETKGDNHAYAIASTFQDGRQDIYATHPTRTPSNIDPGADRQTDYLMTQVGYYALTGSPEAYQQDVSAYRNSRDLAKEYRDEFIRQANDFPRLLRPCHRPFSAKCCFVFGQWY
ncbi:uncharacterized protein KD926_006446 [Aspergillus affinis]|uniref:uncharacterized protein n=1 Tax=Aspergillus affinis TaxID=1070780 RepID=UPI0022FDB396|nr:uncharacterized protein KD926_006446 [Aspergillus affinis]KAI9041900.1 hypothetical protein KD926_006446 [Aspergillus affinis]